VVATTELCEALTAPYDFPIAPTLYTAMDQWTCDHDRGSDLAAAVKFPLNHGKGRAAMRE